MSKTTDDLKAAFAGESQANRKYLAFAAVAKAEGKTNLARLFMAVAEGETIHALKHFKTLGEINSSLENVKTALAGETYEIETMYPEFIKDAQAEGEKLAEMSFTAANEVEKNHQKQFSAALVSVEAGNDIEEAQYHVCSVCGNLFDGELPDNCPICKVPKEKFIKI